MTPWFLALAAASAIAAASASAAPVVPGEVHRDFIPIAGRLVPLPEGEWRVAGASAGQADVAYLGAYGAIESVVLVRIEADRVAAAVLIHANAIPVSSGWGTTRDCTRKDIHRARQAYVSDRDGFCNFVTHVVADRTSSTAPAWVQAETLARIEGWQLPSTWLMAGARVSDRRDILDVRYHFNPEALGFAPAPEPWDNSKWAPQAVSGEPARAALLAALSDWSDIMAERVHAARNGAPPALPAPALPRAGLIPSATLSAPAAQVPAEEPPSIWTMAFYRSLTYRVLSSSTTLVTALPFLGVWPAATYTFAQGFSHSVIYYLHEVGWGHYLGGALPGVPRTVEFPGIGSGS